MTPECFSPTRGWGQHPSLVSKQLVTASTNRAQMSCPHMTSTAEKQKTQNLIPMAHTLSPGYLLSLSWLVGRFPSESELCVIRSSNFMVASKASGRCSGSYLAMHISHPNTWSYDLIQLINSPQLGLLGTPASGTVNIWFTLYERNQESTLVLGRWPVVKRLLHGYQVLKVDPQSSRQKPDLPALSVIPVLDEGQTEGP